MAVNEQKNTTRFSAIDIKKAQMYLNKNWAADDNVSQDAIDYVAKARGAETNKVPIQDSNKYEDSKTISKKVLSDELNESVDEEGLDTTLPGSQGASDDDSGNKETASTFIANVTESGLKKGSKNISSNVLTDSDKVHKKGVKKTVKTVERAQKMEKAGKVIGKGKDIAGTGLDVYSIGAGLEDFEGEGVEDIAPAADAISKTSSVVAKGLTYGAGLTKNTGKVGEKLAGQAGKATKVSNITGAVGGGVGLISDIVALGDMGGKGQQDKDIASQVSSLGASTLGFGSSVAALAGGTGFFAGGAAATGAAAGTAAATGTAAAATTTATTVAAGAATMGPIGWAIAGLTILSIGLSELF